MSFHVASVLILLGLVHCNASAMASHSKAPEQATGRKSDHGLPISLSPPHQQALPESSHPDLAANTVMSLWGEPDPVRLVACSDGCCRLEINHNDEWGTVCSDWFDNYEAAMVCRQLGCSGGGVFGNYGYWRSRGSGRIWMTRVQCNGYESGISFCGHNGWGNVNCDHNGDVGVCCDRGCTSTAPVRMEDCQEDGCCRLEVKYNNEWGTVCDDGFSVRDSWVACRQLGCTGGRRIYSYGGGKGPIWMDKVQCGGGEYALSECPFGGWWYQWGKHNCDHHHDVGICCDGGCNGRGDPLRMADCRPDGCCRVEINHDGQWGTICDDSFSEHDAQVVCKQLGCSGGRGVESFGGGQGPIWMDEVSCSSREAALSACAQNGWGRHDCSHSEDVGVCCTGGCIRGNGNGGYQTATAPRTNGRDIRMADCTEDGCCRVEIMMNGMWGSICDIGFSEANAAVVCRQLGCPAAGEVMKGFGRGTGMIWMDGVQCQGSEGKIQNCPSNGWGRHDCTHEDDVGVCCRDGCGVPPPPPVPEDDEEYDENDPEHRRRVEIPPPLPVRLVGCTATSSVGGCCRVEIKYSGMWGTVCDDGFSDANAAVVCRQVGCSGGVSRPSFGSKEELPIWMSRVSCTGQEDGISNCKFAGWGKHDCAHYHDVGVCCNPGCAAQDAGVV